MRRYTPISIEDGQKVFVYTTDRDGCLASEDLDRAFLDVHSLVKFCESLNERYMGQSHRQITIFEVSVRRIKQMQIGERELGPAADWPRD